MSRRLSDTGEPVPVIELVPTAAECVPLLDWLEWREHKAGVLRLVGSIAQTTVAPVLTQLRDMHMHQVPAVEVHLTSGGGDVYSSLALYDGLRGLVAAGTPVTTIVHGYAGSAAAMIVLQAGARRLIGAHARLLIHELRQWQLGVTTTSTAEDELAEMQALTEVVTSILAERSGRPAEAFAELWRRREVWMSAQDALAWGLVDAVA